MHIMTIVGARPQFIKAAAISRALTLPVYQGIRQTIVHTGQHYDANMSENFFKELEIPEPDINLSVGKGFHGAQTGAMIDGLEGTVRHLGPDLILIYGDTNSTLAGALVAAKTGVPLAHVEAGLRSFRRAMPEEVNRIVADRLSQFLFCPTPKAVSNLETEGRVEGIHLIGDVMYDVFLHNRSKIDPREHCNHRGLKLGGFVLASVHRAENTDNTQRLLTIFHELQSVSRDLPVVVPVHPRTRAALDGAGFSAEGDLNLIPPVSYSEMMGLLCGSSILATDSGGLQKEAYFANTPCITLRDETEWEETLDDGWNLLVPPEISTISRTIRDALQTKNRPQRRSLYGDGRSAEKILSILLESS